MEKMEMQREIPNPVFSLKVFVKIHTLDFQQWKEEALLSASQGLLGLVHPFATYSWDNVADWFGGQQ